MNSAERKNNLPRMLVAGVGPLPPESLDRLYAPGLRVWGIASELARAGHAVRLVERLFGKHNASKARVFDLQSSADPSLSSPVTSHSSLEDKSWPAFLKSQADEFRAAAAIGSTDVMNHALATANLKIPLWCDFFGDPMAERQ